MTCNHFCIYEPEPKSLNTENKLMDLPFYLKFSKKIIRRYAGNLASSMIRNEDAIAEITYWLIIADIKWKPHSGRALNSWRISQAKFAIQRYIAQGTTASNKMLDTLDQHEEQIVRQKNSDLGYFDYLQDKANLTDIEVECLKLKFGEDFSLRRISDRLTLTQSNTTTIYNRALTKVKKLYQCNYLLL